MADLQSLEQACTPRASVFDPSVRDTVYNIDDLNQIDAGQFFAENWITEGMRILLDEAFKRLDGRSASTRRGAQRRGRRCAIRRARARGHLQWAQDAYALRGLGRDREQLGRKDVFKDFNSPLQPPGDADWVELLRGEPVLLLLDELPPYFEAAMAVPIGATHLDTITTTALANLRTELPAYWDQRLTLVALLRYLASRPALAMTRWKADAEAASDLATVIANDRG